MALGGLVRINKEVGSDQQRPERSRAVTMTDAQRTLSDHRIARIQKFVLQDRYPRSLGRNARLGHHGSGGSYQVRLLTTDKSARGWGMSHGDDREVERFIGWKVSDLWDPQEGTRPEAYLLDIPVHDLVGHILDVPVFTLFGSKGPNRLPIYSGAIYFDDLDPEDNPGGIKRILSCCQQDYEAGYRAFKLKIGRGFRWMSKEEGLKRDIDVTLAVRERFPDCRILVDANDGYTLEDAVRYLTAVADCDLFWLEEPFPENRDDLLRLKEAMARLGCKTLIADGESRSDQSDKWWRYGAYSQKHIDNLYRLAEEKLVDVFVLDLGIVGFSNWRLIMPELERAGVKASPHTWAWIPRPFYVAQLAAGVGNVVIVEGIPGTTEGVDYSAYRFTQGLLTVPDLPGFGLKLAERDG
ncbi:MAG: mandelate racemase [Armatimonadetes bacterium]|nr:mandelate racemase [Armatimonadota bacterium]MDW8121125.1 enolase C-terminal domain-like protein [Armatimonadota bacterium]